MRIGTETLDSPHPLGVLLPSLLQEDRFAQALTAGLDWVLAPIITTFDCIDAYIDTELAPTDFLAWLGTWVGALPDQNWPIERQRAFVRRAVELYRIRGTVPGLIGLLEVVSGGEVQIAETGGVAVSPVPNGELPGEPQPRMSVRVMVDDPSSVSVRAIDAVVAEAKPAYVVHKVEVVKR
jgi:phage tail-like protein